jgi:hypothetical protein
VRLGISCGDDVYGVALFDDERGCTAEAFELPEPPLDQVEPARLAMSLAPLSRLMLWRPELEPQIRSKGHAR